MGTSGARSFAFFVLIATGIAAAPSEVAPTVTEESGYECPHRWVLHEENCYLFERETYTWFDAQATCHYMDSKLVELESEEENQFVANYVQSHNVLAAWIGLTDFSDEGTFVWTSTREVPEQTFWWPGEPTDSGSEEDCVYIWKEAMWVDQNCENYKHPFVCEMPAREISPPVGR